MPRRASDALFLDSPEVAAGKGPALLLIHGTSASSRAVCVERCGHSPALEQSTVLADLLQDVFVDRA